MANEQENKELEQGMLTEQEMQAQEAALAEQVNGPWDQFTKEDLITALTEQTNDLRQLKKAILALVNGIGIDITNPPSGPKILSTIMKAVPQMMLGGGPKISAEDLQNLQRIITKYKDL